MQRAFSPWIIAALLFSPSLALAMENHTLSLGYAQTHLSALKKSASKDLRGLNLKYRYEFNSDWGVLTSLTATRHEVQHYRWDAGKLHKDGDNTTSYSSLMVGPTYRINDYVSLYGNVGMAGMKVKNRDNQSSQKMLLPMVQVLFLIHSLTFPWMCHGKQLNYFTLIQTHLV